MAKVYEGGWKFRFSNTPFMNPAKLYDKQESILAHELCLIGFWSQLRKICPVYMPINLSSFLKN